MIEPKIVEGSNDHSFSGIHHCATLGDLWQQIKDIGTLLELEVIGRDR
jgi:hypothetical protein